MSQARPLGHQNSLHDIAEGPGSWVHRTPIYFALFLSTLLGHAPARAEPADGCLAGDWITEARAFVTEETGIPAPEICVRFGKPERLNALVPAAVLSGAHGESVAAVYIPVIREIVLADDLDPRTPLARGYLVHELVHAQQFAKHLHEHASCLGVLEGEAYSIQALYLRTKGLDDEAFLLQALGMFQSACGYSY